MKSKRLWMTLVLGVGLTIAMLWLLSGSDTELSAVHAANLDVCPSRCAYSSIQAAVDAASDGDVIRVATGTYTSVSARAGVTQVVYVTKSVTIRGGYTPAFTEPPDPEANPTTLDAQRRGRVLYISGNITVTLEGLRITGGYAEDSGGGIVNKGAALVLANTTIVDNIADGLGGGMYVEPGNVVLSEVQIISNTANLKGGGVFVWGGSVTGIGGQITRNSANGPTFWDGGGGIFVLGSATLNGTRIISNSAIFGGGLYVYIGSVTLSEVQIIDNVATWSGGGVYVWPGAGMTLNGGAIRSNSAHTGGGVDSGGAIALTNSVVADNRANGWGSGLCLGEGSSRLLHTTIARNIGGHGSGVHVAASATVAMTNTIVATHTVGITVTAGCTATLDSTLWYDNANNWDGGGTIFHSNDHTGDPAFVAPDAGDYHIKSDSAAVDAGVYAGVAYDIDRRPRPCDGDGDGSSEFDIGADEYSLKCPYYMPLMFKNHSSKDTAPF